jgi:VanZ family protein
MPDNVQFTKTEAQRIAKVSIFGFRLAALILSLYWLAIFTGTHLPRLPRALPRIDDKTCHFLAYFGLATLMCYSVRSSRWLRRLTAVAATAMVYAAIDEFSQRWIPRRSPDLWDFAADVAGICTAIILYMVVRHIATKNVYGMGANQSRLARLLNRPV